MGGISFLKPDEKREIWANRVDEFKTSNLSQKSWCKEQGINVNTFRYWLKKREEKTVKHLDGSLEEFELASVSIIKDNHCPEVIVEINDVKLSISADYDEMFLIKVIKTLKKL